MLHHDMKITHRMICELAARFSGKHIVCKPAQNPTEVICEIARCPNGLWSVAVALICESVPHYHKETQEVYRVLRGSLRLFHQASVNRALLKSDHAPCVILPGTVHWAKAVYRPAEVLVMAFPAWTAADHILVESVR